MLSIRAFVVSLAALCLAACGNNPNPADLNPADFCGSGTHLDPETATCQDDVDTTPIGSCGSGTYLDDQTQTCLVVDETSDDDAVVDDDDATGDDDVLHPADFCGAGTHLDDETGMCTPNLVLASDDDDLTDDDATTTDDDSVSDDDAVTADDDVEVTETDPVPTCVDDLSESASWRTRDLLYLPYGEPIRVRTTSRGFEPEDLRAYLIDVVPNPLTHDISDPYMLIGTDPTDDRWTPRNGLAHGDSGGTIIIQCRVAGASSYGIGATIRPFAFEATPIENMIALFDYSDTSYAPGPEPMAAVLSTGGMTFFDGADGFLGRFDQRFVVTSPISGGFAGAIIADEDIPPLVAGSPISVVLVTGDMIEIGAGGTVTMVDGDHLLAFGHPFQADGHTGIPYAAARVQTVIASPNFSTKIMSRVGPILGVITEDRFSGIKGTAGLVPNMINVTTNVQDDGGVTAYHHDVVRQPNESSYYAGSLIANTAAWPVEVSRGMVGPGSVFFTVSMVFAEYEEPLEFSSVASSSYDPVSEMFYEVLDSLQILAADHVEVTLMSLTLDAEVQDDRHEYTIEDVTTAEEIQTNEDLVVVVTMSAYREDNPTPRAIIVPIPIDFPVGDARVTVESTNYYYGNGLRDAETLEELLEAWNELPHGNQLIAQLTSISWTQPRICEPIECPEEADSAGEGAGGDPVPIDPVCEICEYVRDENGDLLKRPSVRVVTTESAAVYGYDSTEVTVIPRE